MASAENVLNIVQTGGGLGAEVRGVDLRLLDDAVFAEIHRAWLDNLVLLFRGQTLSDSELIAFSRWFGELDLAPIQETGRRFVEGMPELYVVSNVLKNGEPIGSLGNGEAVWHTDMSTMRVFVPRDLTPYPNILTYLKRIGERPAFQRAMKKADPDLTILMS